MKSELFILSLLAALTAGCGAASSGAAGAGSSDWNVSNIAVGRGPGTVVIADLNLDQKPDIAVANSGGESVTVLLGDGRGNFSPAQGSPFAAGHEPNDIAVADFNEDGKPDLGLANHETKYLTILLGDGRGAFAPAPGSPVAVQSNPHPHGIAAADFNRDRHTDLLVESWQENKVLVLMGDGKGNFQTPGQMFDVGSMPYVKVRAGDVNADGNPDIITTNFRGRNVTVLLGDGRGGFAPATGSPFAVTRRPFFADLADLNGDGRLDIAIASYSGQGTDGSEDGVTVLLGDGRGGFSPLAGSPFATTGTASGSLALGDLNGDRRIDIALANGTTHNVTILLADGRGSFRTGATVGVGREPYRLAAGDLNGDGKADIVTANNADNNITVILSK